MRGLRGLFIVLTIVSAAFGQNPELPECQEGTAQPSAMVLVSKLERAFKRRDAAAFSAHARCPFGVGKYETDDIGLVPPRIFAERFLDEVTTLDLTLKKVMWVQRIQRGRDVSFCGSTANEGAQNFT